MAAPDWDQDSPQLRRNLKRAIRAVRDDAIARNPPTLDAVRQWHKITLEGLRVPRPEVAGHFRGDAGFPSLEHCRVWVGPNEGTKPQQVQEELQQLTATLKAAVDRLDDGIPQGATPDEGQTRAVLKVAAWAHAGWVGIHPFANGNGRTARMWANWVLMRYGLPPVVRLRPRPAGARYAEASARAMEAGDHVPTYEVFRDMLQHHLNEWASRE